MGKKKVTSWRPGKKVHTVLTNFPAKLQNETEVQIMMGKSGWDHPHLTQTAQMWIFHGPVLTLQNP